MKSEKRASRVESVLSEDFNQTGRPKRDEKGPFVPFCAPFVPFGEERPVLATFLSRFVRKPLAGCPVYRANGMAQMWLWLRGAGASRFCPVCARRRAWIGPVWPWTGPCVLFFSAYYPRGFFVFVREGARGRKLCPPENLCCVVRSPLAQRAVATLTRAVQG